MEKQHATVPVGAVFRALLALTILTGASPLFAAPVASWPCVGRPAIVVPGGTFGIGVVTDATAYLVGQGSRIPVPVSAPADGLPIGVGVATLPDTVPPGRYSLVTTESGVETLRVAAVHVLAAFPETYTVALLRADGDRGDDGPLFTPASIDRAVDAAADITIVLGTLSRDGSIAAYQALETQLVSIQGPVFYCPDSDELARGTYRTAYGEPDHALQFGDDGYLFLGAGLNHADSRSESRIGPIHQWRRLLRASRWSIGVASHLGPDWAMRSQLVMFVDDPLDYVIAGDVAPGFEEKVPWGRSAVRVPTVTPALQIIDVSGSDLQFRAVSAVAPE